MSRMRQRNKRIAQSHKSQSVQKWRLEARFPGRGMEGKKFFLCEFLNITSEYNSGQHSVSSRNSHRVNLFVELPP